jgi:hypothetical protein
MKSRKKFETLTLEFGILLHAKQLWQREQVEVLKSMRGSI